MGAVRSIDEIHAKLAIKRTYNVSREEYLDYMTFKKNERPLFTEIFGPITGLKEEWAAQGAAPAELDFSVYRFRHPKTVSLPVPTGWTGGHATIIEETDTEILCLDRYGRKSKLVKSSGSLPLPLEYPVKNMDDWLKLKEHYLFNGERLAADWRTAAEKALQEGAVIRVGIPGGFDEPRQLLGEEELCVSYYTQPELIHDMLATIADTASKVLDRVSAAVPVDELFVHEDMAGKSGPLAGPKQVEEFIKPYYRRIWDMLADRGARLFSQDSDGNMDAVIEPFLDAGLNVMYPMEPAAGMDIVRVREKYGSRLAFMGGIDKHVLRQSKDAIDAELEYKLPPMIKTGGCLFGLDHRIPNGTPLENYKYYIGKVWEIIERESE